MISAPIGTVFAWLPIRLRCGRLVWLEHVWPMREMRDGKINKYFLVARF